MNKVLLFLIFMSFSFSTFAQNYCAGIRGNGELAPAHWGALAKIIEHKGMPEKVAGGSSASITMFFLDAISRNKAADTPMKQSLMLKSLVPHIMYILNEDAKAPKVMKMVGNITGLGDGGFFHKLKSAVKVAKDVPMFFKVLGEYGPLLNPAMANGLRKNFSFYKGQIGEAVKAFGSFDARVDKNLFFRKGLIDFKTFGLFLGRIADFYAGHGSKKTNVKLSEFLNTCESTSENRIWSGLIKESPQCDKLLTSALDSYYSYYREKRIVRAGKIVVRSGGRKTRTFPNRMIFEKVGSGMNAFPTTSIVSGNGEKKYYELLQNYEKGAPMELDSFSVDFDTELNYGYWGREQELSKIKVNLATDFSSDLKSQKFMPLTQGSWFEALATSPAEPGIANLQRIPDTSEMSRKRILNKRYFHRMLFGLLPTLTAKKWFNENNEKSGVIPFKDGVYSAGGWSDLHPSLVLKASGCADIVYVTRQGGESVFGQQVFIRLTGYTKVLNFWKDIKEQNRTGWRNLTSEQESSPWNKLYNIINEASSYNTSIKNSTAIYCTDWDSFAIFKGEVDKAQADAYTAPVFVNDPTDRALYPFGLDSEGRSEDNFPGCILKDFTE